MSTEIKTVTGNVVSTPTKYNRLASASGFVVRDAFRYNRIASVQGYIIYSPGSAPPDPPETRKRPVIIFQS